MISINVVRNVVMFILNKNNNGYITPDEFNSYCNLAQLDIFENMFFQYNNWLNKENKRMSNTEYANIPKNIREQIDVFATYADLDYEVIASSNLWSFAGTDLYRTMNVSLVNAQNKKIDIEEANKSEINRLVNTQLVSITYPIYEKIGADYRLYPIVDPNDYTLEMFYLRTPKYPKWTYVNVGGNPVYNASATDLQDIELHISNFNTLVVKVLGYCGISIREQEVEQTANSEELKIAQKKS